MEDPLAVIILPAQQLLANQWFFSAPTTPIATAAKKVDIQVTDPNSQWYTRPGNVKVWGIQMEGYVGGPWDNVAPWAGWGWFLYDAGAGANGDPQIALTLPAAWTPFGTSRRGAAGTPRLFLSIDSSQIVAAQGKRLRMGMQTDADIQLGLQITLT